MSQVQMDIRRLSTPTRDDDALEMEFERQRVQVVHTWADEAAKLRNRGLRADSTVLDCACGPGFTTAQLVEMTPQGRVIGLDRDVDQMGKARRTLAGVSPERCELVEVDLLKLDPKTHPTLREGSIDFVYSRHTFQWVDDWKLAVNQVLRLLKPGGSFCILEIDNRVPWFAHPAEFMPTIRAVQDGWNHTVQSMNGKLNSSLDLPVLFREVGFVDVKLDFVEQRIESKQVFDSLNRADTLDNFVKFGAWTQAERVEHERQLERFFAGNVHVISKLRTFVSGTKPS